MPAVGDPMHRNQPEVRITDKPLHSADFRSSIPDGAVMDPGRAGAIVAMQSPGRLSEITDALEGLGLIVAGCGTKEELSMFLINAVERPDVRVPEVLIIDAEMLGDGGGLIELLQRAECIDSMIVILPESWPRGVTPLQLEQSHVLHAPFPMSVLVEEVAQRMTPSSVSLGS